MNRYFFILFFLSVSSFLFSQNIIKDEYIWHDHREIETESIEIPVSGEVKVKMNLNYNMTKGLPDICTASFYIGFRRFNSEYINHRLIIKTSSGKIYETNLGNASISSYNIFQLPPTWTTISWYFTLNKKNIKYFTSENIEKMKIRLGNNSIDLVFKDSTLTNFIREGYELLKKRSKTKLPESANPAKYNGF